MKFSLSRMLSLKTIIVGSVLAVTLSASSIMFALPPQPAEDQAGPIAIVGAMAHIGDGTLMPDAVITFENGVITNVASLADDIDLSNHQVIDMTGQHIYPGFVLPNTTLGLEEVSASRATLDFVEEGDINASVRAAIAYNTDSQVIPTVRFNGILTAQVTPQGGLVSGSSSVMNLDGWNWEDAALQLDDGLHLFWPTLKTRRFNRDLGRFETIDNPNYTGQVQLLRTLFRDAQSYTGEPLNLNLEAMQGLFSGNSKLYLHANGAKEIISVVGFARSFPIDNLVLMGAAEALKVKDLLIAEDIPVVYDTVHSLPGMPWHDIDAPFKMPFLLHEAGLTVGISNSRSDLQSQRNLPFFAGTAAAYGLDPETALSLITKNNAEIMGIDDQVGTLEVGKDATLFVSLGDALDMRTSQVIQAFIQGRDLDLMASQQQLYERFESKYRNQSSDE